MTSGPVALLRRYHDALNAYEEAVVAGMFAPAAVYVSPGVGGCIAGRDAIIRAFTAYFAEHPDQHAEDESVEALSPRTARATWRLRASARSTGRPVTRRGVETVTFDDDGLILHVEVRDL